MIPSQSHYRPQLDGLRALAVLLTVAHHLPIDPWFVNGTIGVDIFFALSGWLITWLLLGEREKNGRISLSAFYIRRVFRIVPMYYLTIAGYFAAGFMLAKMGDPDSLRRLHNAALYLLSFNFEYLPKNVEGIMGHAWTLGIEEKFYIFWPFILVVAGHRRVTLITFVFIVALLLISLKDFSPFLIRGYVGLGFGALAAYFAKMTRTARLFFSQEHLATLAAILAVAIYILSLGSHNNAVWNICMSLASAFLVGAIWFTPDSPVARTLGHPISAYLGRLTYTMYLVHVLVINVVTATANRLQVSFGFWESLAVSYVLTFFLAAVLNRFVEEPLIAVGRRLANRSQRVPKEG